MPRYRVEFSAVSVDEFRLQSVLKREFGASEPKITRDSAAAPKPPQPKTKLEAAILECLANGRPWRRKALLERVGPISGTALHLTLLLMAQSGAIRKVRHGIFISINAPPPAEHEIPELQKAGGQSSHSKVLALLSEPKSAPALRDALRVSRQRVDQILKRLVKRGDVRRFEIAGERGAFVYVRADCFKKDMLLSRLPELHESRARILSTLSPETLCRASDVGLITQIHHVPLYEYLDQLSAMGFVVSFKLGQKRYVGITPRGLEHPQRDGNATKVSAADIVEDFGETRVRFILMLRALGQARTIDLTFALPRDYFDDTACKAGQVIQRLEMSSLIEEPTTNQIGKQPFYQLTEKGRFVAGILSRAYPKIQAEELRQIIAARRCEYTERLRKIQVERDPTIRVGLIGAASATQAAILRALQEHGRLSTTEISSKMDTAFKNPRSIHLALRSLEKRGAVKRAGVNGASNLWEVEQSQAPV